MFADGVATRRLVAECAAERQRRPQGSMRPLGGGNACSSEMFDGPRARDGAAAAAASPGPLRRLRPVPGPAASLAPVYRNL
ncbi:hypothetical protein Zmor_005337 [Zophobas morio]|uniref:Uncharacterized protein n=1 Tax=Zophobas morio TaxID=2755281 RepID=A0AA38IS15_9CUCU|nr:hypothetical protein Zmor_005337 [Zophobas morio]